MKRSTTRALLLSILAVSAYLPVIGQQTAKVTSSGIGYLEYLPDGYRSGSDKYPVVIFLHGYKEKGTSSEDPNLVLRDLPRAASVGLPRYVRQGKKYPFILITPQLKANHDTWPPSFVMAVVNHVKRTLRVDEKRIYLTGLSLGGYGVWKTAGEYPQVFAAIGPVCSGGNAIDKADEIARANVAVWGFHGGSDHIVSHNVTTRMVSAINSAPKKPNPLAKVTIFPGMGHNIWDKAYNDSDLLKWMLRFRKGSGESPEEEPPSNKPPVANAGQSKTITLPVNTASVKGGASDEDGEIVDYRWTKRSGPDATFENNGAELRVSDLEEGTYIFRLTVKDNDGATASDEMTLTVKAAANEIPVVDAGSHRTLTLPSNEVTLEGSATDKDGKIESYLWQKVSGGVASFSDTRSVLLHVSGLLEGNYVFRLTVTDDQGESNSDDVKVTVKAEKETTLPDAEEQGEDQEAEEVQEQEQGNGEQAGEKPSAIIRTIVPILEVIPQRTTPGRTQHLPVHNRTWLKW